MKYQHQAIEGGPVETFSDAPVTIGGVKIKPRWAWSRDYAKWARRAGSKSGCLHRDKREQYAAWLAERGREMCHATGYALPRNPEA